MRVGTLVAFIDADTSGLKRGLSTAERDIKRTESQLNSYSGRLQILLGAVAAAAPIAGAAITAGVGAGFIALAAYAQKSNAQMKNSFLSLKDDVLGQTRQMTSGMVDDLANAASDLQGTFDRIAPSLGTIFKNVSPDIAQLTGSVNDLAVNAMPGLNAAIASSGPIFEGFRTVAGDAGTGVSDFFAAITQNSQASKTGLVAFGGLVQSVLSNTGKLINQLTVAWAKVGPTITSTTASALDALTGLTAGGLTPLATETNLVFKAFNSVLKVLGPISGAIGTVAGDALGAVGIYRLLGKVTGALATKLGKLPTAASKATIGLGGSVKAGEKAAKTIGKVTRAVSKGIKKLPILGAVVIGVSGAFRALVGDQNDLAAAMMGAGDQAAKAQYQLKGNDTIVNALSFGSQKLKDVLSSLIPTTQSVNKQLKEQWNAMTQLQRAQTIAAQGAQQYQAAVDEYGKNSPQAIAAQQQYAWETEQVSKAQDDANRATRTTSEAIQTQRDIMLGSLGADLSYQQSLLSLKDQQDAYSKAVKQYSVGSRQAKEANLQLQQAYVAVANAAKAKADAQTQGFSADQVATAENKNVTAAVLKMAVAAGTTAPAALQKMVIGLGQSTLAAYTGTAAVKGTHKAVVELPNGKKIKINVDSNGVPVARATQNAIDNLHGKDLWVTTHHIDTFLKRFLNPSGPTDGQGVLNFINGGHAAGGYISGPGSGMSDSIPSRLSNGEFVVNARSTALHRGLLESINSGGMRRGPVFDAGGYLRPGPMNYSGNPEPVLTAKQWQDIHTLARRGEAALTAPARTRVRDGITIEHFEVKAFSDRFSIQQVQSELAMHGVS